MSYICKCCEYETVRKLNYDRHLLSSKHIKKHLEVPNDGKKENPACLNQKLMGEINMLNRKYTKQIKKLEEINASQAIQILQLKEQLLNN